MSQITPAISVVIPAYNVSEYITQTIESLLSQTFGNWEAIIVNDCSPDNSADIARGYALGDPRIRVIDNHRNKGTMETRRVGYESARGEFLIFCDGDDYLPEKALEALYVNIAGSDYDVVLGQGLEVFPDGSDKEMSRPFKSGDIHPDDLYRALICNRMMPGLWGYIFRRSAFTTPLHSIEGQCINEDYLVLIQMVRHIRKAKAIGEVVYCYVSQPDSITRKKPTIGRLTQDMRANQWGFRFLVENDIFPDLAHRLYIRRIVQAMEYGFTRREVLETGMVDTTVFNLRNIVRYVDVRYAGKYLLIAGYRGLKSATRQKR